MIPTFVSNELFQGRVIDPEKPFDDAWWLQRETEGKYAGHEPKQTVPKPLIMSVDVASEYAELRSTINSFVGENIARFITGKLDVMSADWDDYLAELDKIGIDRYLEIVQNIYDAQFLGK